MKEGGGNGTPLSSTECCRLARPPPRGALREQPSRGAGRPRCTHSGRPSCVGHCVWKVKVQEGRDRPLLDCASAFAPWRLEGSSAAARGCEREAVFLRTRLPVRPCGAIFRPLLPAALFKDSAQAANRYIYNHSVSCPSVNAAAEDAILGGVAMVTVNPLPWRSLPVGALCSRGLSSI